MGRLSPSVAILRTQSDERLVALARDGHEAAFTAIVERYRRPMLAAVRRFLPEARAEDAVQQTFVAAWKGLQRGDEVRELRPWLYRIARNTALNALRAPGYDVAELQESLRFAEAPQDELERREAMRRTLAGLAALPERQREALLRTAIEGDAHADIARDLGLSEGAARQLVMRARTTLRSAASAVIPLPVLHWLVASGASAGAGTGAAAATLAKAGAVVFVAGAAVATPVAVVVEKPDPPRREAAVRRAPAPSPAPTAPASAIAARTDAADDLVTGEGPAPAASRPAERAQRPRRRAAARTPVPARTPSAARTPSPARDNSGPGSTSSGRGSGSPDDDEDDDRSGSNSGPGSRDDDLPEPDDDSGSGSSNSGSGSTNSGSSGSGSGSDDDDLTDNSGSGSADDLPEIDDEPDEDDSSGSGSDHD